MRCFLALAVIFGGCGPSPGRTPEPAARDREASPARSTTPRARTASLTFVVEDGGGTTLTLAPLVSPATSFAEAAFGDAWASAPVEGGRATLDVATPGAAAFRAIADGVELAAFVPLLHEDVDGDGVPSGDERVVGAGRWWPAYARSTGGDLAALGLVEGWNVLRWGEWADGRRREADAIPVRRNLGPVEEMDLSGFAILTDGGDYGMVVLPAVTVDGGETRALLDDERLSFDWGTHFDTVPYDDHFAEVEGVGLVGAEERVYAYLDRDHDDRYGGTDGLVWEACWGTAGVRAAWFDVPTTADDAVALARRGLTGGWNAWVDTDGGRRRLGPTARGELGLIPSCPVE